jgi:hypothetical protein
VSCEAEQRRLDQAESAWGHRLAYASGICASRGYDSIECQGAQGEADAARGEVAEARQALAKCLAANPQPTDRLLEATGYVTFLRVNEPGGGYGGGSTNWFDADVIFKLHTRPDKAFGFRLRDDSTEPIRRGMLTLLDSAIVNKLQVITDYIELGTTPNNNCFVIRVALTQTPPPSQQVTPETVKEVMS